MGEVIADVSPGLGLVRYPFPLRPGGWVYLYLPADLTLAEVEKIVAMLRTLPSPDRTP